MAMDYSNHQNSPAPYHYERVVQTKKYPRTDALKGEVFQAMDELKGWCSKEKAAVLVELILRLKPMKVVEIGVYGGKSLVPMAYAVRENGFGKVYGIDPWDVSESVQGMDGVNYTWWNAIDHQKILRGLNRKIIKFNLRNQIRLIKSTSEQASPIHHIDLLHIDGNHSSKTSYQDVTKWAPLVNSGGIIIFDDIGWETTARSVEWLDKHCKKVREYSGDNTWGIWLKP